MGSKSTSPRNVTSRLLWALFALTLISTVVAALVLSVDFMRYDGPQAAVFPLPERYAGSYSDDWGASRTQGEHEGTDIFAPAGTPIYSITDGVVRHTFGSDEKGWNNIGGYSVMVRATRDAGPVKRGDRLYYAHMNGPTPLHPGDRIEAGQKIGEVGSSGEGPKGTTGRFDPHLHLGWYSLSPFEDRPKARSGAMNTYPLLKEIEKSGARDG